MVDGFQEIGSIVAIWMLALCIMTNHQAERIDDDMTLAALGLLASIIAPDAVAFGLAIDHTGRRT